MPDAKATPTATISDHGLVGRIRDLIGNNGKEPSQNTPELRTKQMVADANQTLPLTGPAKQTSADASPTPAGEQISFHVHVAEVLKTMSINPKSRSSDMQMMHEHVLDTLRGKEGTENLAELPGYGAIVAAAKEITTNKPLDLRRNPDAVARELADALVRAGFDRTRAAVTADTVHNEARDAEYDAEREARRIAQETGNEVRLPFHPENGKDNIALIISRDQAKGLIASEHPGNAKAQERAFQGIFARDLPQVHGGTVSLGQDDTWDDIVAVLDRNDKESFRNLLAGLERSQASHRSPADASRAQIIPNGDRGLNAQDLRSTSTSPKPNNQTPENARIEALLQEKAHPQDLNQFKDQLKAIRFAQITLVSGHTIEATRSTRNKDASPQYQVRPATMAELRPLIEKVATDLKAERPPSGQQGFRIDDGNASRSRLTVNFDRSPQSREKPIATLPTQSTIGKQTYDFSHGDRTKVEQFLDQNATPEEAAAFQKQLTETGRATLTLLTAETITAKRDQIAQGQVEYNIRPATLDEYKPHIERLEKALLSKQQTDVQEPVPLGQVADQGRPATLAPQPDVQHEPIDPELDDAYLNTPLPGLGSVKTPVAVHEHLQLGADHNPLQPQLSAGELTQPHDTRQETQQPLTPNQQTPVKQNAAELGHEKDRAPQHPTFEELFKKNAALLRAIEPSQLSQTDEELIQQNTALLRGRNSSPEHAAERERAVAVAETVVTRMIQENNLTDAADLTWRQTSKAEQEIDDKTQPHVHVVGGFGKGVVHDIVNEALSQTKEQDQLKERPTLVVLAAQDIAARGQKVARSQHPQHAQSPAGQPNLAVLQRREPVQNRPETEQRRQASVLERVVTAIKAAFGQGEKASSLSSNKQQLSVDDFMEMTAANNALINLKQPSIKLFTAETWTDLKRDLQELNDPTITKERRSELSGIPLKTLQQIDQITIDRTPTQGAGATPPGVGPRKTSTEQALIELAASAGAHHTRDPLGQATLTGPDAAALLTTAKAQAAAAEAAVQKILKERAHAAEQEDASLDLPDAAKEPIALKLTEEQVQLLVSNEYPNQPEKASQSVYKLIRDGEPIDILKESVQLDYSEDIKGFFARLDEAERPALLSKIQDLEKQDEREKRAPEQQRQKARSKDRERE